MIFYAISRLRTGTHPTKTRPRRVCTTSIDAAAHDDIADSRVRKISMDVARAMPGMSWLPTA